MTKALITGITGQDGSYLAELLVEKGYEVTGLIRYSSVPTTKRIAHLLHQGAIRLIEADLLDGASLQRALQKVLPDEVYNLAAMSHVHCSFSLPDYAMQVNGLAPLRLFELIKQIVPKAKVYQAATSEMFGKVTSPSQNEKTPFYPRSPYGLAKLCAFWGGVHYREAYNMYICNGILFNHESPRRGEEFVSRKISFAICRIALGLQEKVLLGNLEAKRDWGYAKEFVYGMWQMLQQPIAEDFVLATGKAHTVREFVERAFARVGIMIVWEGKGIEEKGIDLKTGKILVEISPSLFRPAEVDTLLGDATKAKEKLGWEAKTSFPELVAMMVQADYGELS